MNGEFPSNNPRAELEARVTAYILGELPAHEAAALRQEMDEDAELSRLYDRLKETIALVREAAANPVPETKETSAPLRLSEERREKLFAHFKTVAPKEFVREEPKRVPARRLLEIAAVIAIFGAMAALLLPTLSRSNHAADVAQVDTLDQGRVAQLAVEAKGLSPMLPPQPAQAVAATKGAGKIKSDLSEDIKLPPQKTTIVLPPTEDLTVASTSTSQRHADTDVPRNPGAANEVRHENIPVIAGNIPANIPPDASNNGVQDGFESRVFKLKYANAKELASELGALFPNDSNGAGDRVRFGAFGGAPQQLAASNPSDQLNHVTASADARTGSLTVNASKEMMPQIAQMVEGLDSSTRNIQHAYVYTVTNAEVFDVQPVLQDLFSSSNRNSSSSGTTLQNVPFLARSQNIQSAVNLGKATGFGGTSGASSVTNSNALADGFRNEGIGSWEINGNVTNSIAQTGDPDWIGSLGHPDEHQAGSNQILARNGAIALSRGGELDLEYIHNQASNQNPEFRFYTDVNGNAKYQTNPATPSVAPATGFSLARLSDDGSLNTTFDPGRGVPLAPPAEDELRRAAQAEPPPNVTIHAKFAEVTQEDNRALGFTNQGIASGGALPGFNGTAGSDYASNPSGAFPGPANPQVGIVNEGTVSSPEVTTESGRPGVIGQAAAGSSPPSGSTLGWTPKTHNQFGNVGVADGSFQQFTVNGRRTFANHTADTNAPNAANWSLFAGDDQPTSAYAVSSVVSTDFLDGFASTNGTLAYNNGTDVVNAATDEAIRRQAPRYDNLTRYRNLTNSTNLGAVTVTVDPDTKRTFFVTDEKTAENVSNSVIRINRKGAALAQNDSTKIPINYAKVTDINDALRTLAADRQKVESNPAYQAKKQELAALKKEQEVMALQTAQASMDRSALKTPRMEVIERADDKKAQDKTVGQSISQAFTGKVTETAKLKVERDVTDVPGVAGKPDLSGVYDPYFVQTEFEVIQSEKVLDQVIDKLKLDQAWAKKKGSNTPLTRSETRALLKKSMEITTQPNTSLIDIKVKGNEPAEAAKIANTIADVYTDLRRQQREAAIAAGQAEFKSQLAEQNKKIAKVEVELAQLEAQSQQGDAPLPKQSGPAPIPQPEISTSDNAFSTFSLNIADVSFKLAAASLEKDRMPEPASIRSEEFINAFDYRDPEPAHGAPLGFAWERARYPFAHNRDLLRFSVKTAAAGREAGRPMNIVLLLDKSGSMERADRVKIIHEALRVLATQLGPQDKISVVTFARTARLWVDSLPGNQAGEVADGLDKLTPEGGTNLEDAMRLAYETARRHYIANGINRVVLLTDGAANLGNVDPESLKQKAEAHRKEGVALDCFGVGWEGYNDDLLEVLSRNGGGRYGFLNTPEEAANGFGTQLAGALHVAASDLKVQVEFNPKRVTAYRQIGYAKHQLTKEQFRDNTVNAAQVAAAESGNALYVIEVNPNGDGPIATVRVRYKVPGTEEYPEHEWVVPYEGNALPLDQSSPAMRLAATVSAFSEWLAASPFAGEVTTDQLLGLMRGVPETYGADERPKKLEWMIRQAGRLSGK